MTVEIEDNAEEDDQPVPLTQTELNDLTRDLSLSKESAHLLGSCLKEKYLLAPGTIFYWYQDCEMELRQFFTFQNKSQLVYCNNIEYDALEWRLFIDSSSRSLKAVLLHNGNSFFIYPDLLHSHIHEYGHVRNGWNGHRMLITIEHRNLRIQKHITTSCSGTKPFY